MRIMWQDLPEPMATAYEAQLGSFSVPAASRQEAEIRQLEAENDDTGCFLGVAVLTLDLFALIGAFVAWGMTGGMLGPVLFLAISGLTTGLNIRFLQWCKRRERCRLYRPERLRVVLPLVPTTGAETMYVRALLKLAEPGQDEIVGESTSRSLLLQMNALLSSSYEINKQQQGIQNAMSDQSRSEIEAMHGDLKSRVSQAKDSDARVMLLQTLSLCEARLERAKALDPLKERLEAQQEMIVQTLASVGESLAGLQIAPRAVREPQVESIQESLEQIQYQTRSIEQAVQEVMALRSF
ncbi:MAG: hypothetical protein V4671_02560 [Armatimonadota bacterium]